MRETPLSAAAFEEYYNLGEKRSLDLLAQNIYQKQSKPIPTAATILSQLKKWSSAHQWQDRIIERDKLQAELIRAKKNKEIEKMNEEHALLGRTQALRAVKQIEELIKVQKFGSQAAVQLLKVSTDLERLARGAATDRQEITGLAGAPFQTIFYLPKVDEESEEEEERLAKKGGDTGNANESDPESSKD